MPASRLLDIDPLTNSHTLFHVDPREEIMAFEEVQDCTDIVEVNKALASDYDERSRFPGDGLHRVASIPVVVYFDLMQKGILDDQKAFARWLDDPQNAAFRTRPGKMSR